MYLIKSAVTRSVEVLNYEKYGIVYVSVAVVISQNRSIDVKHIFQF